MARRCWITNGRDPYIAAQNLQLSITSHSPRNAPSLTFLNDRNATKYSVDPLNPTMKKSSLFAASVAAASATALSSSSKIQPPHHQDDSTGKKSSKSPFSRKSSSEAAAPPSSEKFAPRFDGLRFIETLVTAHR